MAGEINGNSTEFILLIPATSKSGKTKTLSRLPRDNPFKEAAASAQEKKVSASASEPSATIAKPKKQTSYSAETFANLLQKCFDENFKGNAKNFGSQFTKEPIRKYVGMACKSRDKELIEKIKEEVEEVHVRESVFQPIGKTYENLCRDFNSQLQEYNRKNAERQKAPVKTYLGRTGPDDDFKTRMEKLWRGADSLQEAINRAGGGASFKLSNPTAEKAGQPNERGGGGKSQ